MDSVQQQWLELIALSKDAIGPAETANHASQLDIARFQELTNKIRDDIDHTAQILATQNRAKMKVDRSTLVQELASMIWLRFKNTLKNMRADSPPEKDFGAYIHGVGRNVMKDYASRRQKLLRRETLCSTEQLDELSQGIGMGPSPKAHVLDYDWLAQVVVEYVLRGFIQRQHDALCRQVMWVVRFAFLLTKEEEGNDDPSIASLLEFAASNNLLTDTIKKHVLIPYLRTMKPRSRIEFCRHCIRIDWRLAERQHLIDVLRFEKSDAPSVHEYKNRGEFEDDSSLYRGAQKADTDVFRALVHGNQRKRRAIEDGHFLWFDMMDEIFFSEKVDIAKLLTFHAPATAATAPESPNKEHDDAPWLVEFCRNMELRSSEGIMWFDIPSGKNKPCPPDSKEHT